MCAWPMHACDARRHVCVCAHAGGRLSTTAVDVIFVRHRSAASRRLGFKEFVEALSAAGYEMGIQFEDIMVQLGCKAASELTPADSMVMQGGRGGGRTVGRRGGGTCRIAALVSAVAFCRPPWRTLGGAGSSRVLAINGRPPPNGALPVQLTPFERRT